MAEIPNLKTDSQGKENQASALDKLSILQCNVKNSLVARVLTPSHSDVTPARDNGVETANASKEEVGDGEDGADQGGEGMTTSYLFSVRLK